MRYNSVGHAEGERPTTHERETNLMAEQRGDMLGEHAGDLRKASQKVRIKAHVLCLDALATIERSRRTIRRSQGILEELRNRRHRAGRDSSAP